MATTPKPKGFFVDTNPTPQNLRALWERMHALDVGLTAAQTAATAQGKTITTLNTEVSSVKTLATTALTKANSAQSTATAAATAPASPPGTGPAPGTPPPGLPPSPPTGPPVTGGKFLTTDMIDLTTVTIVGSPPDIATWPITTTVTNFTWIPTDSLDATFSKKTGAGRWPDYVPPGWGGPIQYTLWLFLFISGKWYGAGAVIFWFGETVTNYVLPSHIGSPDAWWLYGSFWSPMSGVQPQPNDTVGFMVSAGIARATNAVSSVKERSQVFTIPFPTDNGGIWTT